MTYEEAKNWLECGANAGHCYNCACSTENYGDCDGEPKVIEAIKIAIEALEKQMPKRPMKAGYDYICPNCGRSVHNPLCRQHHCKCGQKIDWRDK